MSITTNRTRRTAGTVSLLAALLLVLQALVLAGPATAAGNSPADECGVDVPFVKIGDASETSAGFSVANYDFNNGSVGDVITVYDVTGDDPVAVITVEIDAIKGDGPKGETIQVTVSLLDAADFTIEEVVVKTGASDDFGGDSAVLLPGHSDEFSTGNNAGNGLSHLTMCLGELPDDPDPVDATPSGELTSECGAWSATVAVSEGDQPTNVPVTFEVREGETVIATTTLGAGEDDALGGTFDEDTGVHALTLVAIPTGGDETQLGTTEVTTDCEQPPTFAPAATASIECETPFVTLDNTGSTEAVTFQVSGAVEGGILEVEVPAGETDTVDVVVAEDADYEVTVSADGMDDEVFSDTYNCEETEVDPDTVVRPAVSFVNPTCEDLDAAAVTTIPVDGVTYATNGNVAPGGSVTVTATAADGFVIPANQQSVFTHDFADPDDCVEVAPQVIEKPQPAPQPAPEVAAQELAATGLDSVEMLLLALLLLGLGAAALLAPEPRRVA